MGGKAGAIAVDVRPRRRVLYVRMCYTIHRAHRTRYDDGQSHPVLCLEYPHESTAEAAWDSGSPGEMARGLSGDRRALDEGTTSMVDA